MEEEFTPNKKKSKPDAKTKKIHIGSNTQKKEPGKKYKTYVSSRELLRKKTQLFRPVAVLKLLPTLELPDPGTSQHDWAATWCCKAHEALRSKKQSENDRVVFVNWLRTFRDEDLESLDELQAAALRTLRRQEKLFKLICDTLEALQTFYASNQKARGMEQLLLCAYVNLPTRNIEFFFIRHATSFLCLVLDVSPQALLDLLLHSNLKHLDVLQSERRRVPIHCREQLYCTISFIQAYPEAATFEELFAKIEDNTQTRNIDAVLNRAKQISASPLPFWQRPTRQLAIEFGMTERQFIDYITDPPKTANKQAIRELRKLNDKPNFSGENFTPTRDEMEAVFNKIAISNQYYTERSVQKTGEQIYYYLRRTGYTKRMMRAIIASDYITEAAQHIKDDINLLQIFITEYTKDNRKKLLSETSERTNYPLPLRMGIQFGRAFVSQYLGKSIAAGIVTYAVLPTIMSNPIGIIGGMIAADALLRYGATSSLYGQQLTTEPNDNQRVISQGLTAASVAAALAIPIITSGYLISESTTLQPVNSTDMLAPTNNSTDVSNTAAFGMDAFGGTAGYLAVQVLLASLARPARQLIQSLTTSNFSAGIALSYVNGDAITEDDRESINAIRDLLYLTSTVVTLCWPIYFDISPVWAVFVFTSLNEANDETFPDLANLIALRVREMTSRYKDSDARYAYVNFTSPSMLNVQSKGLEFFRHFFNHSASRINYSGMADLFSLIGDIFHRQGNQSVVSVFKTLAVLFGGLSGPRRGAFTTWQTEGKNNMPSGLLTWCLRSFFGVRDTTGVLQIKPVVRDQVQSLEYDAKTTLFKEIKLVWGWESCKSIAIDEKIVAYAFAPDETGKFHQAEQECVNTAIFNMLCLHSAPREYRLLVPRCDASGKVQMLSLGQLCILHKAQKEFVRQRRTLNAESIRLLQNDFHTISVAYGKGNILAKLAKDDDVDINHLLWQHAISVNFGGAAGDEDGSAKKAIFLLNHNGTNYIYSPLTDNPLETSKATEVGLIGMLERYLTKAKVKADTRVEIAFALPLPPSTDVKITIEEDSDAVTEHIESVESPSSGSTSSTSRSDGEGKGPSGVGAVGVAPSPGSKLIYHEATSRNQCSLNVLNMVSMYVSGNNPKSRVTVTDLKKWAAGQSGGSVSPYLSFRRLVGLANRKCAPLRLATTSLLVTANDDLQWESISPNIKSCKVCGLEFLERAKKGSALKGKSLLGAMLAVDKTDHSVVHYVDPHLRDSDGEQESLDVRFWTIVDNRPGLSRINVVFPILYGDTKGTAEGVLQIFSQAIGKRKKAVDLLTAIRSALKDVRKREFLDTCCAIYWAFDTAEGDIVNVGVQRQLFMAAIGPMHDQKFMSMLKVWSKSDLDEADAMNAWNEAVQRPT